MTSEKNTLGNRMKEFYENRSKTYLTRKSFCIIRCDGKAFHSLVKQLKKPYDKFFHNAMNETMRYLCENIQGCKFGYTQSDEISLLLTDTDTITTDAWFNYSVQKICSVGASMATLAFNKALMKELVKYEQEYNYNTLTDDFKEGYDFTYHQNLKGVIEKGGIFDCRCFNIPENEIVNYFIWREGDCTRNAIQMLGQCNFSHKELQGKNNNEIQEMLFTKKGIDFNKMPTEFKSGVCCIKKIIQNPNIDIKDGAYPKTKWVLDKEIPIFTQNKEYIEYIFAPHTDDKTFAYYK